MSEALANLPIFVPHKLLVENPKFSNLLHRIAEKIGENGMTKEVEEQYKKSEEELRVAREKYLQHILIYNTIQELILEKTDPHNNDRQSAKIYSLISHLLSIAECKLHTKVQLEPTSNEDNATKTIHLLGLKPSDFSVMEYPVSTEEKKQIKETLTRDLKKKFEEQCLEILELLEPDIDKNEDPELLAAKAANIHLKIDKMKENIATEKKICATTQIALDKAFWEYYHLLQKIFQVLVTLIEKYKLGEQAKYDEVYSKWLELSERSMTLRLSILRYEILSETYTADKVEELKRIRKQLERQKQESIERYSNAKAQLRSYQEQGPEFHALVKTYDELQQKIENKKYDLQVLENPEN